MSHESSSVKAIIYALGANFGIAVSKGAAAIYTGSGSMLAETVHSFADCTNQLLLLLGMRQARRAPDAEHPLGYGKAVYFWSFIVALLLFSMGGLFSLYEGIHKLQNPEEVHDPVVAFTVLLVSILLESGSLAGCIREIRKIEPNQSLWRFFRDSRNSELIVVMGEDLAALAGLGLALVAVGLTLLTGNPLFDAAGSMAIGVLLIIIALMLSIEMHALLIGQSAEPQLRQAIRDWLQQRDEITELYNLITLRLGADVMVAVKAKMQTHYRESQTMIHAINTCEAELRCKFPAVRWIFFEPDHTD